MNRDKENQGQPPLGQQRAEQNFTLNQERLIESFMEFVKIDSESGNEKAFCEHLWTIFSELGCECFVEELVPETKSNTGNLIVKWPGNREGSEAIIFSCHMDTVKPGQNIQPVREVDRLRSDGRSILGADDKAGIAALVEAFCVIKENNLPHGDLELLLTVGEECGLLGARHARLDALKGKAVYVIDSSDSPGMMVTRAVAQEKIQVVVHGKEAHAGVSPEEGVSAIVIAAKAISAMKLLRVSPETTANFGRIEGGGATNIVTARVELSGEARSLDVRQLEEQVAHMRECFEKAAAEEGGRVEFTHWRMYSNLLVPEGDATLRRARQACEKAGLPYREVSSGGGSDGNIYQERGLRALTMGMGAKKAHSLEEYILLDDLINTCKLVLSLIEVYREEGEGKK